MSAESTKKSEELASEQPFAGPGSLLRRERLAQGLALDKVANQLHLSQAILERLEDDDFEKLPGPVFIQGYLRNYARLLGLGEETVMGPFHHLCPEPEQGCLSGKRPTRIANEVQSSHGGVKLVTWLIVLGLVALLVVWWQGQLDWRSGTEEILDTAPAERPRREALENVFEPTRAVQTESVPPMITPLPEPFGQAADNTPGNLESEVQQSVEEEMTERLPIRPEEEAVEVTLENLPAPVGMVEPQPAPAEQPQAPQPAADGQLVFEFSGPCWVEVRDANGKAKIFGEMREGVRRTLDSSLGPFRITLGNADVVKLTVEGQTYDLTPHVRGNVARFNLDPANP